jgi:subtilisin family serine protease
MNRTPSRMQAWGLFAVVIGITAALVGPVYADKGPGKGGDQGGKPAGGFTGAEGFIPGQVAVKLRANGDVNKITAKYGTTVIDSVPGRQLFTLKVPAGSTEAGFVTSLRKDGAVTFAEVNGIALAPERQMHLAFDGGGQDAAYVNQAAYQQANLGATHTLTTGAGVIVAVLDTGATFTHPALAGKYLPGANMIDPSLPPADVPDGTHNSAVGHGTMVAGIIARLAPGAKILPVRVLNGDGIGTNMDIAKGVHYALQNGARIINASFGATEISEVLKDALDEAELAGVMIVASAGNSGLEQVQFPASGRGGLAVGAVDADNRKADFSSYGSFVRVVAPGVGIRSTYWDGGYANWSGTSFSTPFVTAQAVLILSANPALDGDLIEEAIRGTARSVDALNPAYRGELGKGIIDIEASVRSVLSTTPGP